MISKTATLVTAAMVVLALLAVAGRSVVADPSQAGQAQQGNVQLAGTVASKISYQGRLTDAVGNPLSGSYDLMFQLWNDATAGSQVGSDIVKNGVPVSNGLFTVELDVPQSALNGQALWLRIRVGREWLSPRQPLLPAPYALGLRPGANVTGDISGAVLTLRNTAASDAFATGVYGQSDSTAGSGVYGYASAASGAAYGVKGASNSPTGTGVYGLSNSSGNGVAGQSSSGNGVSGISSTGDGVRGQSSGANKSGVYGVNTGSGFGVYGSSSSGNGVTGISSTGDGVRGEASAANKSGVYGVNTGSGFGVYGASSSGYAGGFKGNVAVFSRATGAAILELGEGLDYAEGFDVSDQGEILPGTVLVIDPDQPGKLTVSNTPYDRKVAGIVTGAKGLGSGVRLGVDQFDYDVALAGRVYCSVDATYGEVSPGDLLTTSPTPGYAMVVKDYGKAQGAILGKAMEGLPKGERGQILVLVSLQ